MNSRAIFGLNITSTYLVLSILFVHIMAVDTYSINTTQQPILGTETDSFSLVLESEINVPVEGKIRRAEILVDNTIGIVIGDTAALHYSNDRWTIIADSDWDLIGIGLTKDDTGANFLEVIDASSRSIVRIDANGNVMDIATLPARWEGLSLNAAVVAADRWYGLGYDSSRLYLLSTDDKNSVIDTLVATHAKHTGNATPLTNYHLSAVANWLVVTEANPPFTWRAFSLARTGAPNLEVKGMFDDSSSSSEYLTSLPVLPLSSGFFQMLVDLTSLNRLIIRYDHSGKPLQRGSFKGPLGFVDSDPACRSLLGVRSLRTKTLVTYHFTESKTNDGSRQLINADTTSADRGRSLACLPGHRVPELFH